MSLPPQQKSSPPYQQQTLNSQQTSNPDQSINQPSNDQIQLQFKQENMNDMHRFDIKEIYANKEIVSMNKYRSGFVFLFRVNSRGGRHLIAIQKKQVIWTILKLIVLSAICYYLNSWITPLDNIYPFVKTFLLLVIHGLPFLLLIVMLLDPGYILDHEIVQNQYQSTDDKRRPKDGKYCEYCKLFVKRKTGHCYQCHHCVSNFDHHCGIMARCVGRPNAVLFYAFAILANIIYMGSIMLMFYEWVLV